MTRTQMQETIRMGMQSYFAACFTGEPHFFEPGHVLATPENSEVKLISRYTYDQLENALIDRLQWAEDKELDDVDLQIWSGHFWYHAKLILQEHFEPIPHYMTPEMEARRASYRQELADLGYIERIS